MKLTQYLFVLTIALLCISTSYSRHTSWRKKDLYRMLLKVLDEENKEEEERDTSKWSENSNSLDLPNVNSLDLSNVNSLDLLDEEETGIEKRSKAKTVGHLIKWTIAGGAIMGGASMLVSFSRLGFDLYFEHNRQCCGFDCCRNLCGDKIKFDGLKSNLAQVSKDVDKQWVEVQKMKTYVESLNSLVIQLRSEVERFDKSVLHLLQTLTSQTEAQIIAAINDNIDQVRALNKTRDYWTKHHLEAMFTGTFGKWETETLRWALIFDGGLSVYMGITDFKARTIEQINADFKESRIKYNNVYVNHVGSTGATLGKKFIGRTKVVTTYLKTNYKSITHKAFSAGVSVISVYSSVQDILHMTQRVNTCKNLTGSVSQAIGLISPELSKAQGTLRDILAAKQNLTGNYNLIRDSLKDPQFIAFTDQVMRMAQNSSKAFKYSASTKAIQDFNTKIVTNVGKSELEINLLPNLIKALQNITDRFNCMDRKFAIIKTAVKLCQNEQTMYNFQDVWNELVRRETEAYQQGNCLDTNYITQNQLQKTIEMQMTDAGLQTDCFLNSKPVFSSICTEWRKGLTDQQILTSLTTRQIAPITRLVLAHVSFFVKNGCPKNHVSPSEVSNICAEKTQQLSRSKLMIKYARYVDTEVISAYDGCPLTQYLITNMCSLKEKRGSLASIHSTAPYSHYTIAKLQEHYDTCVLTVKQKEEICFLNKDLQYTVDEIMVDIPYYPRSMIQSAIGDCQFKTVSKTDEDKICALKNRACKPNLCPISHIKFDVYRSKYGLDLFTKSYNTCPAQDEEDEEEEEDISLDEFINALFH